MPQVHFSVGRLYLLPNGADTQATQPVECGALQDIDVSFEGQPKFLASARAFAVHAAPGRRSIKARAAVAQISGRFLAAALAGNSAPGSRRVERDEPATITAGAATAGMPGCVADLGVWDVQTGRQFDRAATPAAAWQYSADDAGAWAFHPGDEGRAVTINYLRTAADGVRVVIDNAPMGYTPRFGVVLSGVHRGQAMTLELDSCVLGSMALNAKLGEWLIPGLTFSGRAREDGFVGRLSLEDEQPPPPPWWWEPFTEGLGPYGTVSGNRGLFSTTSSPWGPACYVGPQNSGEVAAISRPVPGPLAVTTVSFKARYLAANPDDSAVASFYLAGIPVVGFIVIREAVLDPARGAYFSVRGAPYSLGVTATINEWHRLDLAFTDVDVSWVFTNLDTATVLASGSASRAAGLIAVDEFRLSADSGGLTCPTEFDDAAVNISPP